ncbi:xanthine dehydrogenase family protein molybdopterin-binding subunit [Actinopolymorpha alba]|uniref:xanthine dehydrogenase family protein molybdopterin-binding subunit n=1 Tax=Actinopolymorpha alba TaxID=533267 RepID=UPI00037F1276|nr:xanthine dehydrogenase family protein molybdopterin-binding subunit [Actinopolymorpha alba]
MTGLLEPHAIGQSLTRLDGPAKVTGTAPYAFEQPVGDPLHLFPVQATIARGRVTAIDSSAAEAMPGVAGVLTHTNAPRLASDEDRELWVLQSDQVAFRGQFVAAVLAETPEIARHAASLVRVEYAEEPHEAELRADSAKLYAPDELLAGEPTNTFEGDVDGALAAAAVTVDQTYTTPMEHNNPMEPHATIARWDEDGLTLYDSTQGAHTVRVTLAPVFGLDPRQVRVIAPYVGGGFGSKGMPHAHNVLAGLAARMAGGRPVKFALTRQQMYSIAGYRPPTIQRIQLGAGADGRLTALAQDVIELSSKIKEYAEPTGKGTRVMYAAPHRRITHRLDPLDVPVPTWMRAPGECPGMFALEVAMDELAVACGLDPIEVRVRNDAEVSPESGLPWSSRNLVACLREGARRFGWERRDPTPGVRRDNGWLIGTGVASSTYPVYRLPGSVAMIRLLGDGRYRVSIGAADIGTGTWTALTQVAADALGVPCERVDLRIGDTALPMASVEGGSSGITSWGSAIVAAAQAFRDQYGTEPADGAEVVAETPDNPDAARFAMQAFGAQFAEVRVHVDTGEIRVPRMLGVFAAGRIINPRTARSQFIGGMTMGLSMALHEQSVMDPRFGLVVNHDLAEYHIAANADVGDVDAIWIDEHDPYVNPMGSKGIGEIGIVGAAAAVANAAYHATGIRVRDLPITADRFLS